MALADRLRGRAELEGLRLGRTQLAALVAVGDVMSSVHDGVYLHGPAGRGKTWLLDAVAESEQQGTRRYHWTEFFTCLDAEIGRRLDARDRLPRSLDAVVGDCSLLCFDELEVTDPDDAGLLEHLLIHLARRGTRLVLTSNQAPGDLLAGSPFQHWARGLVRRLEGRFAVCHVDDGVDYRTLGGGSRFASGGLLAHPALPVVQPVEVVSGGRRLPVQRDDSGVLWADFRDLLSTPTGRQDYLALCAAAPTVGLDAVPALHDVDADTRQRFVTFVDVAHDTDTRLLLVLTGPADWTLLPSRTVSRLGLLQRWSRRPRHRVGRATATPHLR